MTIGTTGLLATETNFQASPNCLDGPGTATDTGFVATLLAP
jgi:hypothetical protein